MTFCDNYTKALTLDEIEKIKNGRTYKKLLQLEKHFSELEIHVRYPLTIASDALPIWENSSGSFPVELSIGAGTQ